MLNIILSGQSLDMVFISLFAFVIAIMIGMTTHEWAHGYVAYKNGDMTAKFMGRLSLNPLKHFDPIGFLMLAVVGFGWAKPVPIDSSNFRNPRKGVLTTSLAGVIMNFIIGMLCIALLAIQFAITKAVGGFSNEVALRVFQIFYYIFMYTMTISFTLMAFNILPIFPLDGFHVLECFVRYDNKYCVFMRRYGMFVLLALLLGSSVLGRITPYLDIFGLYMNAIMKGVNLLLNPIFSILG